MQHSFQGDLFLKHREGGIERKLIWIASVNLCYLPNALVIVRNWYGGDGFANEDFLFLIKRWVDFMLVVIGNDLYKLFIGENSVKVTAYCLMARQTDDGGGLLRVSK